MGRSGQQAVLAVLCSAQLVFILDISVVNVALVPLAADLNIGPAGLQLVAAVYAAAFGGVLLLGGRIADRGQARAAFIAGLVMFAASSALCGAAPDTAVLITGRGLQGLGAGLASPAALALLTTTFAEGPARDRALGTWASMAAAGGAIGLLLGGALTAGLGWRSVFYVNVALVVVIALAARRILRRDVLVGGHLADSAMSAAAAGGAVVLVVVGLSTLQAGQRGFAVVLLVAGAILVVVQRVVDLRAADPLVPLAVLRVASVNRANVIAALLSAVVLGVNYFLAVHLQGQVGLGPLATGLAFLPITVVSGATAVVAARTIERAGPGRLLTAGMATMAVGCVSLAAAAGGRYLTQLPGMVLLAAGMGVGFAVSAIAATGGVAPRVQGAAAALLSTSTQVGAAIGLAVFSLIAAVPANRITGDRAAYLAMAAAALTGAGVAVRLARSRDTAARAVAGPVKLGPLPAHAASCLAGCTRASIAISKRTSQGTSKGTAS